MSGVNLPSVHLECIAIRQLTPLLDRMMERLDEPPVARPFLRRYSVDVACEFGLCGSTGWLRRDFMVHKHQSCHDGRD
jgi:hypothetical protein